MGSKRSPCGLRVHLYAGPLFLLSPHQYSCKRTPSPSLLREPAGAFLGIAPALRRLRTKEVDLRLSFRGRFWGPPPSAPASGAPRIALRGPRRCCSALLCSAVGPAFWASTTFSWTSETGTYAPHARNF